MRAAIINSVISGVFQHVCISSWFHIPTSSQVSNNNMLHTVVSDAVCSVAFMDNGEL